MLWDAAVARPLSSITLLKKSDHRRRQIGHSSVAGIIWGLGPAGGKAPQIGKIVEAGPEFIGGGQLAAPRSPEFMQSISLAAYPTYQPVAIGITQAAPGAAQFISRHQLAFSDRIGSLAAVYRLLAIVDGAGTLAAHGFPKRPELVCGGQLRRIEAATRVKHDDRALAGIDYRADLLGIAGGP